jgi:hypothetical protein
MAVGGRSDHGSVASEDPTTAIDGPTLRIPATPLKGLFLTFSSNFYEASAPQNPKPTVPLVKDFPTQTPDFEHEFAGR